MRHTYKALDKLTLGNLILTLEADLDSIQLQLQPRYDDGKPFPRNIKKIRKQVQRCLSIARRLQARFPQEDYTLNRCHYLDELPNKPMSEQKKNWYKFKRLEKSIQTTL